MNTAIDPDKIDIGGLTATIGARLAAESRLARAKAFGWLCGGAAISLILISLGGATALWGYSHMISVQPAADMLSRAMAKALEETELKTNVTGTMALSPTSQVSLAPGQTVRLEDGALVKLDPRSSIRVIGDLKLDMPQPSKQQLQLDATPKSNELPITNYTIFRSVGFGGGEVVTGWHYGLSDGDRPKAQYCYYAQSITKGVVAKYTLAFDGSPRPPSPLSKPTFNFDAALANCIWFSGR